MYTYQRLFDFAKAVFIAIGHTETMADTAATVLVSADMRGVDSHGIARLKGYVRLWEVKRINASPKFRIDHETPSTAVLNADESLGLISGPEAMKIAIIKAKSVGTGWVCVKNSNHYGIAGYHAMMALEEDMIGISMTNASPLVAPTFSKERLLGTNPIAVAVPAGEQPPFVADMATTTAANGKLEILQRKEENAPLGWVQDQAGNPTTDAHGVKTGGALLPLGGDREHASHKGYILGSIVDIFSAVLSGANYGPWVPPFVSFIDPVSDPVGEGLGHFFGAMRIDAFRKKEEFKEHMDTWITRFRNSAPVDPKNPVQIPGDFERKMEAERSKNGIPLLAPVVADLNELAQKFNLTF
jgi:LDH2 family malate/lactate/ureidoglycolate dehydrogenase